MNQTRQTPKNTQRAAPPKEEEPRKPVSRLTEVRQLVATRRQGLTTLLGKTADVDRWARVYLSAIEASPDLMGCTNVSIVRALMHSAEVNLQVGGAYPHAYVIPYFNKHALGDNQGGYEAQFQTSVWGYTELIRRSGKVKKVWADVVFANDDFELVSGTEGKIIRHSPQWFTPRAERGSVLGSYACALLENGEVVCEPVSFEELQEARKANRGKTPAWDLWPEQQYQKVALKRLSKYLPKGEQAERALLLDDDPSAKPIIDVEGNDITEERRGPLDRAVAQNKRDDGWGSPSQAKPQPDPEPTNGTPPAQQAKPQPAQNDDEPPAGPTMDRDKVFSDLCDADERWRSQRARFDVWDDINVLAAAVFLRQIFQGVTVDGEPPKMPVHMRLGEES